MIKKYCKLLAFSLVITLIAALPVSAKKMTLAELGSKIESDYSSMSAYIIGDYVFTSEYTLKTKDIMLASRSISASPDDGETDKTAIYEKMNIFEIYQEWVDDKPVWKVSSKNYVGSGSLDVSNLNVRYINYDFQKEDTILNVNLDDSKTGEYKTYLDRLQFTGNDSNSERLNLTTDGTLTGLLLKNDSVGSDAFPDGERTGYYFAFVVKVPNATTETSVTLKGEKVTKKISYQDFEEKTKGSEGFVVLYAVDPNSKGEKKIVITADLDGEGGIYGESTYTIDYSAITVPTSTKATFSEVIPKKDEEALITEKGYNKGSKDTYGLDLSEQDNNKIKITGDIYKQTISESAFGDSNKTGWFAVINITPEGLNDKTTFEVPCATCGDGQKQTITGVESSLSLLLMLTREKKDIQITIDRDGDGKDYTPTTYTIDYSGANLKEYSVFKVNEVTKSSTEYNELNSSYGWTMPEGYSTTFSETDNKVTISGLIPNTTLSESNIFGGEHLTGYYLAFTLDLGENASSKTTVKLVDNNEEKELKGLSLSKEDHKLNVLKHLHSDDTNRTFTVEVDLDGDSNEYEPYTLEFDWQNLYLSVDSLPTKAAIASKTDASNFDFTKSEVTIKNDSSYAYTLEGSVKKQTINDKENYYVPINIYFETINKGGINYNNLETYGASWSIKVMNDAGSYEKVNITEENYLSGYVTVLFPIYKDGNSHDGERQVISYKIDLDGDGKRFNEITEEIDYSKVDFKELHTVTFKNHDTELGTKKVYTGEAIESFDDIKLPEDPFHTFVEWHKENTSETVTKETPISSDLTLVPYWEVDFDGFVKDLVATQNDDPSSNSKIIMQKSGKNITFDVLALSTDFEILNNIKLFGAMAQSLDYGEITELTIITDDSEPLVFTKKSEGLEALKTEISSKIINLIKEKNAGKQYLNALDSSFTFTIKITKYNENVIKFLDSSNDYTFNFVQKLDQTQSVDDEGNLTTALDNHILVINIDDSFNITKPINLNYAVTINGNSNELTLTNTNEGIIESSGSVVAINNLVLKTTAEEMDSKESIVVKSGSLTLNNVTLPDNAKGIIVKEGAHLNAPKVIYSKENYDNPLIKVSKNGASVILTNNQSHTASPKIYEEVIPYETANKDNSFSDLKREVPGYGYYHYYLDESHEVKWVKLTFVADRELTSSTSRFIRYYDKTSNEPASEIPDSLSRYYVTIKNNYYTYNLISWCNAQKDNCTNKGSLKPTTDMTYYPKYNKVQNSDVRLVNNENEFSEALQDNSVNTIVILEKENNPQTLDVGNITIDRKLTITGLDPKHAETSNGDVYKFRKDKASTIKGQITIKADGVSFVNLKVEGSGITEKDSRKDVITIESNVTSFNLENSVISASDANLDSAIYIKANNMKTNIGTFTHFEGSNLKSFIEIAGEVDSKTVIMNTVFNGTADNKSHIIFHKVKSGETVNLKQNEHKYESDKVNALTIDAENTSSKSDKTIALSNNFFPGSSEKVFRIGVVITDDNDDASGYTISKNTGVNIKVSYIDQNGGDKSVSSEKQIKE